MNKTLFEKVTGVCKDTGLSEKYLQAITEKMGGSIADDSTDSEAIEAAANLISEVAKATQGEATRWVNAKKEPKPEPKPEPKNVEDGDPELKPKKGEEQSEIEKRFKALEEKIAGYEAKEAANKRAKEVADAMEKHGIPAYLRERLGKSIADDEDANAAVAAIKQDLITGGLEPETSGGGKAASDEQVEASANSLLESITVKE